MNWTRHLKRLRPGRKADPLQFDGVLEEIEPRLLFNADAAAPVMALLPDSAREPDLLHTHVVSTPQQAQATQGGSTQQNTARELIVVDAQVPDAEQLLASVTAGKAEGSYTVHWIGAQDDGIATLSSLLAQRRDVTALHLISHGRDGQLQLGATTLDESALRSRLGEISAWQNAFTADADFLLYGCDVAATGRGQQFVDDLALLTGTDVAASTDLTGHEAAGGDWVLEYQRGQIQHMSLDARGTAWMHTLATISFQDGVNSYNSTVDTYLESATPGTSRGTSDTLIVDNGDPNKKQTLIRFDNIIGASAIPLGSTITSATLTVYVTNDDNSDTVTIHRMLVSWGESSTYNSMVNGVSRDNVEAASASMFTLDAGILGSATFGDLTTAVQAWANGAANHGFLLATGTANADNWTIRSSDFNTTISQRPRLDVTYTAPTGPSMDLDANNSSGATGNNHSVTFTEQTPVLIADTDATITAGSASNMTGLTVTLSNRPDGGAESLLVDVSGTSISSVGYNSTTGVLSLTGNDTAANYQKVLRTLQYANTSDNPSTTARTVNYTLTDTNGQTTTATTTVSISRVNDAPVLTSNGGGSSAAISLAENQTAVTTVTATDVDSGSLTYSIAGGADAARFSINSSTGVLTFTAAPDFENPTDAGANNVYDVIVQVSDNNLSDTQSLAVTITDVSSALVVTTTTDNNDSGLGTAFTAEQLNVSKGTDGRISLREALIAANNTAGTDTITFALTGATGLYGEYTINMLSTLPDITQAVVINAASQAGYTNRPVVVLDGNGGSGNGFTLAANADGSTIRGFVIRGFSADGIHIVAGSDNHTIVGNYIGSFNADGSNAGATERNGSEGIQSAGANVVIGGTATADRNVISGNTSPYNIYLSTGANGTVIQGNHIGTDASGTAVFATNSAYGIMVETSSNNVTIGGTANGAGNVISGFTSRGIWATTTGTTTIQGNKIGTDVTGSVDLGNGEYGIYVDDAGSVVIGGTATNAGNVVSGNNGGGIYLGNSGTALVQGNIIGLNAAGTAALGNTGVGLHINNSAVTTVGGSTSAARNIISGNSSHGIHVASNQAHLIQGNYIGTGADGSTLLGNGGSGVYIAATGVTVGGKNAGEGNVIAGNTGAGINVIAGFHSNLIYRNSIHSNGGLGIDLDNNGVTANDYNDGDGGANYRNNFPVITSVVTNGTTTTIQGSVDFFSGPETIYIELFASPSKDASGHGEGRTYLGAVQVTTTAGTGDATFSLTVTGVNVGDWITAVSNVETTYLGASEFAMAVQAVAPAQAPRGRLIWTVNDRLYQQYADWSTNGWSGTGTNGLNFSDDISMIAAAEAPTRNEIIFIGSADVSGKILAGIWNGSSWSSLFSIPVATPSATAAQLNSFAVAYDPLNGNAMLVWDNGSTGTNSLSYAIWDGSSWSAIQTVTAPVSGEVVHMKLVANPRGHDMVLVASTTAATSNQFAMVWNGSSWGDAQTLGTNSSKQYFEANVAYESQSGRALVFYDNSASDSASVQYRVWNGSSWSSEATVAPPAGITATAELYSTVIATDPGSNRIALAAKDANNDVWAAVWDGSSWGSQKLVTDSGVRVSEDHSTMALAFESQSGKLMIAYGKATGPSLHYMTWTQAGGWSAEAVALSMGDTDFAQVVKLYADPYSNTIMLGVQDQDADLTMAAWDGSAWGTATQLDSATGLPQREKFVFVWNRNAPVVSGLSGDTLTYVEDQPAAVLDQGGDAAVFVADAGGYNGASFSVSFLSGSTATEDVLSIRHQGTGAGQIGLSGGNVTYEGVVIGTWSGGSNGANLVIALNANATNAAVSALSRNISYQNTNTTTPSTTSRVVRFVVTNAGGQASTPADVTVALTARNDAPTLTATAQNPTFTEAAGSATQAAAVALFSSASANPVDAGQGFKSLTFTVSNLLDGSNERIVADGSSIALLNGQTGTTATNGLAYSVSVSGSTATVTLTHPGSLSTASLQSVVNGLAYQNTQLDNPTAGTRTVTLTQVQDDGGTALGGADVRTLSIASSVTVVATNDAPAISSNGAGATAAVSVAENSTAVTTVTTSDPDHSTFTYSIVGGSDAARFSLNSSSGALSFNAAPNFEAPSDSDGNNTYVVIVQVSDGSATDTQTLTVTVTDLNEFSVGTVSDNNAAANTVAENAANGSSVGLTARAIDADGSNNTVTYSLSDSAGGRFAIHATTGVVTVANGSLLNFEAASTHTITVLATSADGSSSSQSFNIGVTDVNEFSVGPVSDANAATNTVAENATTGTLVGLTGFAQDADGSNHTISYSLSDNAGGRFAINASTGVVTVADGSLLNFETATSHNLTVVATSSDGSSSSQSFTVQVSDVNEFSVGALSDVDAAANQVSENAATGDAVGLRAQAVDADGSNNTITYSLSDDAGGRFSIDAITGVVTVGNAALLDYETSTSHQITVVATGSDGSSQSSNFAVQITDASEGGVGPIADTDNAANAISEGASNGASVGLTASATDPDATDTVSYSLTDSADGRFAIDSATGVVTLIDASRIDREASGSHTITVRALSSDGSATTRNFSIQVLDVDEFDVGAVSDQDAATDAVDENAAGGTLVGITARAQDGDATTNTITYSLSVNPGNRFAIDAQSGVVTVANGASLDFESSTSHSITVLATSADGSTRTQVFTIAVRDVNEFTVSTPTDADPAPDQVNENALAGALAGLTAQAFDADGTTNSVTYSLSDDAGGRFVIDSAGVVRVANGATFNHEAQGSHTITVVATSADGSQQSQNFTIDVADVDEFDVSTPVDADGAANTVQENAAHGTAVGVQAQASDADGTTNGITYSLSDTAGGRFTIDPVSGVVTVDNASLLDFEAASIHTITVLATSADGSTSSQSFNITLTDANEFSVTAATDTDAALNEVLEGASTGTAVGLTARSQDADGTQNSISYSLADNAGGRFAIDAVTGVVTVADGSLIDFETSATHTITVRATSADGSTQDQNFTVDILDRNEFTVSTPTDTDTGANSVQEGAATGTVVGVTALAQDPDGSNNTVTYSLVDNAGGRFAIDVNTGVVTVTNGNLLDFEASGAHTLTVRATGSDASTQDSSFIVTVQDVNEFDVSTPVDADAGVDTVQENAANGSTVGITAQASDADGSLSTVTYSLSNDAGGRFAIDAGSGIVTVANGSLLNHEGASSHTITVVATSADGSTRSQNFTVAVTDANEFAVTTPVDTDAASDTVAENAATGTTVGLLASAFDADGTQSTVSYSLTDSAGGRFAIHTSTGEVTVANAALLDHESASSHTITVRATSADGSQRDQTFTIAITDVNEFGVSAAQDADPTPDGVQENAANGSLVGLTARATDADGTNNAVSYALVDDAGGRFAIDASTGVVTVADGSLLDAEAQASHDITVEAISSDGSRQSRSFSIALQDLNEFTISPLGDMDSTDNRVANSTGSGMAVGVVARASDADRTGSTVRYTLMTDPSGAFAIDGQTGVVTLARAEMLNRQTDNIQRITVMARSDDGSTTLMDFDIQVMAMPAEPVMVLPEPTPEPVRPAPEPLVDATPDPTPEPAPAEPAPPAPVAAPAPQGDVAMPGPSLTLPPASGWAVPMGTGAVKVLLTPVPSVAMAQAMPVQLTVTALLDLSNGATMSPLGAAELSRLSLPAAPVTMAQASELPLSLDTLAPTLVQMGGLTLSLGSVFWLSRASTLLTSLLVATPIWRTMDPLPVLASTGLGGGAPGEGGDDGPESDRMAEGMFADVPHQHESVQIIG
ncbi:DUF4347 domain-containing protein [Aquabacterium lacunae]|uniref:DUF4347 domain-containing protein n=1 Tax=Aquabacterium lacunae TaxID=2528630 RepID=A0A4Q9H5X5_9BURK|nr:cadherin domain-containing protein [Aquabacterium lacunae]TBO34334.1 DUF4347 domain-containing protein [Aquabacterium lacunae]